MTIAHISRLLCLFALATLSLGAARAADIPEICKGFDWSLDQDLAWLSAKDTATHTTGDVLDTFPLKAIELTLKPTKDMAFAVKPALKAQALGVASYSGALTVSAFDGPGTYQVSMALNGWIDVVQAGDALPSIAFTGKHDCPALRKSVRFEIKSAPFTVQIAGVREPSVKLALRKVE